jgi:uncharacterized protein YbjT (DUF2867 family)
MRTAVVVGSSGVVGSALVRRLAGEWQVRAVSRRGGAPSLPHVQGVAADARDVEAMRRACDGADVLFHLVHSLGQAEFARVDLDVAASVRQAAADAGVGQIVYLGGLGDEREDLSEHLRSRVETGRVLAQGPVPVTVLRSAVVIGRGSAAFETIVALVDRLPGMICPRWVSTPTQPIALADITRYLAGVAGNPEAAGRSFDAAGPEVMTYREMLERIARLRGRRPLIVEVPVLTPRLSSLWIRLVTPVTASVARPLIEGMRIATVASENAISDLVPFERTPFDVAAREALPPRRRDARRRG